MIDVILLVLLGLIIVMGIQFWLEVRRGVWVQHTFADRKTGRGLFLYNSLFGKLFLRGNFIAITIWHFVFVKGKELPQLSVLHELRHVVQWKTYGFFTFIWLYLKENRKVGYKCNMFEERARLHAGQELRCK